MVIELQRKIKEEIAENEKNSALLNQKLDFYEQQIAELSTKDEDHVVEINNVKMKHDDKMKSFQQILESDIEKIKQRLESNIKEKETIEKKLIDTENKLENEINNRQIIEKNNSCEIQSLKKQLETLTYNESNSINQEKQHNLELINTELELNIKNTNENCDALKTENNRLKDETNITKKEYNKTNATNEQKINHLEIEIESHKKNAENSKKQHENLMNTLKF